MNVNHEPSATGSERVLPAPPPVRSFQEAAARQRSHQGLARLHEAVRLLENGDPSEINDVKELLLGSLEGFQKVAGRAGEGRADEAIVEGVRHAARLYIIAPRDLPEAIKLLRLFCSTHTDSLREIAMLVNAESAGMTKGETSATSVTRSLRLLRSLISGFNCFLRNAQSGLYSNEAHVKHVEQAIGFAREAINNLSRECSGGAIGKASARLRGLTAIASFTRLFRDSSTPKRTDEAMARYEVMRKMGHRDVDKLLKCLACRVKPGEMTGFLQIPSVCVEAVGVLRRLAMAAPEVFPQIANAFADAVRCMDESSIGTWGERPALKNATVRHCVVACAAHLADRLGRNPDAVRQGAVHHLWKALNDCCIMQSGYYVLDQPPPPKSAGDRASAENATTASASRGAASRSAVGGTPGSVSLKPSSSRARPDPEGRRSLTPPAAGDGSSSDDNGIYAAERKRARLSYPPTPETSGSDIQSQQTYQKHPAVKDPVARESSQPSTATVNPVERKTYPPLATAPERKPAWNEGRAYPVALGETFERGVDKPRKDHDSGHLVHLKYDFVPGRTNLDVPATMRQGPLGSADGTFVDSEERWKVDMQYESRDVDKPRPVCFSGDASSAQDLECVLVFDGEKFVMDRVSVTGGVKYVQDATTPSRSTGEAGKGLLGKRKEKNKGKRSGVDRDENAKGADIAGGAAGGGGGGGVKRKNDAREKSTDKGERNDKGSSTAGRGIVVAPANRLSKPINKTRLRDEDVGSDERGAPAGGLNSAENDAGASGSPGETSSERFLDQAPHES